MHKLHSLPLAILLSALLAASPALAATPKFTTAPRETGMAIDDMASQLDVYNGNEVADLLQAKSVTVYDYDNSWPDDEGTAIGLLTGDSQSIDLLRHALSQNPAAVKLLADNRIKVDQVVDIVDLGGNVGLYIQ